MAKHRLDLGSGGIDVLLLSRAGRTCCCHRAIIAAAIASGVCAEVMSTQRLSLWKFDSANWPIP
jgi:hypothetical protein